MSDVVIKEDYGTRIGLNRDDAVRTPTTLGDFVYGYNFARTSPVAVDPGRNRHIESSSK